MSNAIPLFPAAKHLGTYVCRDAGAWCVKGVDDRVLSRHRRVETACRVSLWHSGTRFAYVQGDLDFECCWDGTKSEFVTWDEAALAMGIN